MKVGLILGLGSISEIADQINCIPCLAANPQISTTHKMNQIYKNNQNNGNISQLGSSKFNDISSSVSRKLFEHL